MPESSATSFDIQIYLAGAIALLSFAVVLLGAVGSTGILWTLASLSGTFSGLFLFRELREKRKQSKARQRIVQAYLDRLLLARTPEERQPILEEMAAQQFLKGAYLYSSDLEFLDLSFADFSRADLSGATLSSANLVGANFTDATLSYATLSYTSLHGAIFTSAHLRGADLHGADLRQTDLSNAMMRGANLVNATLNNAVLHNSQLHGANLQNADLLHADLSGAILDHAIMPDGAEWDPCTDIGRFTNPAHSGFWQPSGLYARSMGAVNNFPPPHNHENDNGNDAAHSRE
jgi:hypothetical protein